MGGGGRWLVLGGVMGRDMGWAWGGAKQWGGEGLCLWLIHSKLFVRGMQGVTERNSLNWLFGVSCTVLMLSSCIWGGSYSISGEVSGASM